MPISDEQYDELFIRFCVGAGRYNFHCTRAGLDGVSKPDANGLTKWERLAIWLYSTTQGGWYSNINNALRTNTLNPDLNLVCELMKSGLKKLPRHRGNVYRGIRVPNIDGLLAYHQIDDGVKWVAFSSCTIEPAYAIIGNVLFIVAAENGRVLGPYADFQPEREVLYSPGSHFRVVAVERSQTKAIIHLVEAESAVRRKAGDAP